MNWDDLNDEQWAILIEYRGGCSCHLHPPCSNCCNPITNEEAEELGFLDDEE